MAEITSLTITYEGNNVWSYTDNTLPPGSTIGAAFYGGTWNLDLVNFRTDTGGILYNGIPYTAIEYVDSEDSGNNFTPTSAKALIVYLKGINFFARSISGGSSPGTFIGLTDTIPNYFGRAGQYLIVNDDETMVDSIAITIPQNFQDLLNVPSTLIPGSIFMVDPSGIGLIQVNPTILTDAPILFKERKWISKGYRWLTVEGVLQPVANTQNVEQVGAIMRGWVSDDPETIDATWYWMNAGRYKGGDKRLKDSYQIADYNLLAFTTDPDY